MSWPDFIFGFWLGIFCMNTFWWIAVTRGAKTTQRQSEGER